MDVKYWIIVASKDHVQTGVSQGFAQACHGKSAPLQRMKKDDYVIFYSSKIRFGQNQKCQKFTALGRVKDNLIYQEQVTSGFVAFRRDIDFIPCEEVDILPLLNDLEFISNKQKWGYPFRFGFFQISHRDFCLISCKMLQQ